jgi:hypothetical protein
MGLRVVGEGMQLWASDRATLCDVSSQGTRQDLVVRQGNSVRFLAERMFGWWAGWLRSCRPYWGWVHGVCSGARAMVGTGQGTSVRGTHGRTNRLSYCTSK